MTRESVEHRFFMQEALAEARTALGRGDFPVGCVLTDGSKVISSGARANSGPAGNELDHAEIVALRALAEGKTAPDFSKVVVYSTMEPCLMCFATLILSGIRTIVYAYEDVMGGGCGLDLRKLPPLYKDLQISVVKGVCRQESLALFKTYFQDERNPYLKDTLLASYTLHHAG